MSAPERWACRLRVRGRVQGVGFRPFIHRLATERKLCGWVCNDGDGVLIHVEGERSAVDRFVSSMPPPFLVESLTQERAAVEGCTDFRIRLADEQQAGSLLARVPLDRAICAECRREILSKSDRRYHHPFASCTQCGPRYSILRKLPYERHHTSMDAFAMCPFCEKEYTTISDRRFHAEPIACPNCGPKLRYGDIASGVSHKDEWLAIQTAAENLRDGGIVAWKGLGGYQLLVRADDDAAVMRLRERKHRLTKPFAVMVHSIEEAEEWAHVSPRERELLQSPENPIVLLRKKKELCPAIAPNLAEIGLFLPTTPLHVLLLSWSNFPVVATSGNQSEEPILIDEAKRIEVLGDIAYYFLDHNRPILRRVDDSVVRVVEDQPMMLRLARGYAPHPLSSLERWAAEAKHPIPPMLAVGGQQKNTIALWTGKQAILSPHIGDMEHPESRRVFAETVDELCTLYQCEPKIIIGDLHPDYFTTQWGARSGKLFLQVQHHHAHAVACMAEYNLLDREVLGVIWDGTGYGTDGTIWGGEFLEADVYDFRRIGSLVPFVLPGGEAAIHKPNRIALAMFPAVWKSDTVPEWLIKRLGFSVEEAQNLLHMIKRNVNCPRTTSVGRLFDAVAALLLGIHEVSYEGEAAARLESRVKDEIKDPYPIPIRVEADGVQRGDWAPLIGRCIEERVSSSHPRFAPGRFHSALAEWAANMTASHPCRHVVLGGGCFQNARLTRLTRDALTACGKTVYIPSQIPVNDGGLAVGQLAIGMARWQRLQLC